MAKNFFERMQDRCRVFLNEVQTQAVEQTEGQLLLLASPGSGKTTTLNMRIGYLVEEKGADPDRILAVTFSNASARDMEARFASFFPGSKPVKFSTIHSFSFSVALEYLRKKGKKHRMIEGDQDKDKLGGSSKTGEKPIYKQSVIREIYREITGEVMTDDQLEEILTYISYIKNKMIPHDQLKTAECSVKSADEIYIAYEAYKIKNEDELLLDFDDMLSIAYKALQEDAELRMKYQRKYNHILVDEAQDTSLIQNKIIEILAVYAISLCYVGDEDQCIYSWRGAEPEYLLNFRVPYPNAVILMMVQNYRSSKEIVDASNQFIKRNKDRYDKNMFTENSSSEPVLLKDMKTHTAQVEYLVEEIKKRRENLKEVTVLYRNNTSPIALINELDLAGITYYMKDSENRFFTHWIIEDIFNFMRLTYNDKKFEIFEQIYRKFKNYLNAYHIDRIRKLDNNESVFDNLVNHMKLEIYQIKHLEKCKVLFKEMNSMPPQQIIQTIRKKLGYEKQLEEICKKRGYKKENLIGILNTLESFARSVNNPKEFFDRIEHLKKSVAASKFNKDKNAVVLSTMHSSKGLEYGTVFMIDLINGVIPTTDAIQKWNDGFRGEMEEAARLFYVGMTRAKLHLELLFYRHKDGEKVEESVFIGDMRKILHPELLVSKPKKPEAMPKISKPKKEFVRNPNGIYDAEDLAVGLLVKHSTFGNGKIVSIEGESIKILFAKTVRNLQKTALLEKGYLVKQEISEGA